MIRKLRETSQSLTFRIAALLALALLPIGLISVATTSQVLRQADRRAEANLLALTAEAAAPEEAFVRTGIGAASMLAAAIPTIQSQNLECGALLQRFLKMTEAFSFVGFVNSEGIIVCASSGEGTDVSQRPVYRQMRDDPRIRVSIAPDALVSRTSVIIVSVPVMEGGAFAGYAAVSLPHGSLFRSVEDLSNKQPLDLITYNADASILTSSGVHDRAEMSLPARLSLSELVLDREMAFIDFTRDGQRRVFAVVPIVEGQVFALGSWPYEGGSLIEGMGIPSSLLFPVAMWLVCLGVAFLAVQRMVIRPTRSLRARMLTFMRSRRLTEPKHDVATPTELRDVERTWMRLAENVLHDEAELYDTIHQRTVLLKEVHHRVKNNLQLISSILNMQIREAQHDDTKRILRRMQDRVLSLATIHRDLYQTSSGGLVNVGELVREIIERSVEIGTDAAKDIDVELQVEDVMLYPDQAVPMSLLASEAATNAMKYVGASENGDNRMSVSFTRDAQDKCRFVLVNSLSNEAAPESTGMGSKLITAFAIQLGADIDVQRDHNQYQMTVSFDAATFELEPGDF